MLRRVIMALASAALLAACQQEPAGEPAPTDVVVVEADPAAVIAPLYARYRTDPAVTTFPSLPEQAPWTADMRARLEAMMTRSATSEAPILDFDPFVNAQDWLVTDVTATTDGVVERSHATVRAHFVNNQAEDEVVYDLVWESGAWRVDNIRHAGWDLRQIISQGV
jgi:hypothetical protein